MKKRTKDLQAQIDEDTRTSLLPRVVVYNKYRTKRWCQGKEPKGFRACPPCYMGHKPLPLRDGLTITGGFYGEAPARTSVVVGLDEGFNGRGAYPWERIVSSVPFPIMNMGVPPIKHMQGLVKWLAESIEQGANVHVGCVGGHGRTGLVLVALVQHMTGNTDALSYVRDNYCDRAVESVTQMRFLHRHFGIITPPMVLDKPDRNCRVRS